MADKCPECGRDMKGIDPIGHANDLWPNTPDFETKASPEAIARRKKLLAMAEKKGEE